MIANSRSISAIQLDLLLVSTAPDRETTESIIRHKKNKILGTKFSFLNYKYFAFENSYIDIFLRQNNLALTKPQRLTIVYRQHLHKRSLTNMMCGDKDDPLTHALAKLKERQSDRVVLLSESSLAHKGRLCRALLEISMTELGGAFDEEFHNLATKYFGINYV